MDRQYTNKAAPALRDTRLRQADATPGQNIAIGGLPLAQLRNA